jgi:hypothetical protein
MGTLAGGTGEAEGGGTYTENKIKESQAGPRLRGGGKSEKVGNRRHLIALPSSSMRDWFRALATFGDNLRGKKSDRSSFQLNSKPVGC